MGNKMDKETKDFVTNLLKKNAEIAELSLKAWQQRAAPREPVDSEDAHPE